MTIQFPASPANNQIYFDTATGNRYKWSSVHQSWLYTANNVIGAGAGIVDTQIIYQDGGGVAGSNGLTFNTTANTLTANTINAYSMRVTGNLYIGSNTVVISNNSISAQSIEVTTMMVDGSVIPTGEQSNSMYIVANAAFGHSNSTLTHSQAVYGAVNSAFGVINASFGSTNTVGGYANTAGSLANQAGVIANAAFGHSNTTYSAVNSAFAVINSAYTSINAGYVVANSAYGVANSALPKAGGTITGDLVVQGNVTLSGVTTYANTQTLLIGDNVLTLNADMPVSVAPSENAGIEIGRGSSANVSLLWNEGVDKWTFTNDGTTYYQIASNSDVSTVDSRLTSVYGVANAAYGQANTLATSANAYASVVGASANAYSATVGTSANAYASAVGTSTNNYTSATYSTLTQFGSVFGVANGAFGAANSKVATVAGTSGRITSSGTTGITLDLATAGAGAASYSSGISALTVDAYGRVTSVTGSAGYLTGITSGQVTTALGYTPYNSTNPNGYITSSSLSGYASLSGATFSGDVRSYRSASSTTGVYYFSQSGDYYLYWNGGKFTLNGGFTEATGSLRAPLFYDTDNTGYYVDPASTSNLNGLTVAATITGSVSGTAYGVTLANQVYGNNGTATDDTVSDMNSTTARSGFYLYNNPSNAPTATWQTWVNVSGHYSGDRYGWQLSHGYWDNDLWVRGVNSNSWRLWRKILDSNNYSAYCNFGGNSVYGGIYYDGNDTAYYINPNGTSYCAGDITTVGRVTVGVGQPASWIEMRDTDEGTRYIHNNSGTIGFVGSHGSWRFRMADDGNLVMGTYQDWLSNQIRSAIFYDHNDTGYYCDPNGTTNLNGFKVTGYWSDNVLIADLSASGASTIESTTCFTSGTYRAYEIQFQVVPGTMSAGIYMQYYVGGAWRTAAGDYRTYSAIWNAGGSQGYGPNSYIDIGCGGRIRNYAGLTGIASIVFPSRTDTMPIMTGIAGAWDSTIDGGNKINFTGLLSFNSAISGFRIYASSGTISGYVKVYGRR